MLTDTQFFLFLFPFQKKREESKSGAVTRHTHTVLREPEATQNTYSTRCALL